MSAPRTSKGGAAEARNRRMIASKYLEVAEVAATEETIAVNNVVVGVCVLAGVAAADAICLSATGERYAGTEHAEAGQLLGRVDPELGREFDRLVRMKPAAHYGSKFVSDEDRRRALRSAARLVEAAVDRTLGG